MKKKSKVLVTGAGGFVGHHLVSFLSSQGYWVRGVDLKYPEFQETKANEFILLDLRNLKACQSAVKNIEYVFHLAADMGGIGFISSNHADVARNNTLMNLHMLDASVEAGVKRFLFSSTACVYPMHMQESPKISPLKESDAYPANPEEGYGWEKLYMEKLCSYYSNDKKLETRIARFHNVFGPLGTYDGGREKVPAAICRKIAKAKVGDSIEVWGDGEQTRSFLFVEECVEGVLKIMQSDYHEPLNLGTDKMVTINQLVEMVGEIAGKRIEKKYDITKPQGVRGRSSDNTLIQEQLGWSPQRSLKEGLVVTYNWIASEVSKSES